jgi:SAM-dependent methyltransferase
MPDDADIAAGGLDERSPTSHERATGLPWDASYRDGPAPWDIGRPQPALEELAAHGGLISPILDVGCGTGENALHFAARGHDVLGIDVAPTAIRAACLKARSRGVPARFAVADALQLRRLTTQFRTVVDCGLFHTFDAEEQRQYASSLAAATAPGGSLYVLCFSDAGTIQGPHPVSQRDLRTAFRPSRGWSISAIAPSQTYTRFHEGGVPAWLVTVIRL